MVRETQMPAILVEHPFMTNKKEADLLKSDDFLEKCALAIVKALVEHFKLKKAQSKPQRTA
jgi:N-acetylmuramoyl-L-alanine amidase